MSTSIQQNQSGSDVSKHDEEQPLLAPPKKTDDGHNPRGIWVEGGIKTLIRPCLAELIGTFFLVFLGVYFSKFCKRNLRLNTFVLIVLKDVDQFALKKEVLGVFKFA